MNHEYYMKLALKEAEKAFEKGDIPVGAVIVFDGSVIAKAHNQVEVLKDPTAHAEILAITQAAAALNSKRLTGATLYTNLEPCAMCAGAMLHARIKNLYYGVHDPKLGACGSKLDIPGASGINHTLNIQSGIEAIAAESLLSAFFVKLRKSKQQEN